MNKALYKIVGNGVNITPKVKCELDGVYRVGPRLNRSSSLTVTPGGQAWHWTVVCVRSGSSTLGRWVDRSTGVDCGLKLHPLQNCPAWNSQHTPLGKDWKGRWLGRRVRKSLLELGREVVRALCKAWCHNSLATLSQGYRSGFDWRRNRNRPFALRGHVT